LRVDGRRSGCRHRKQSKDVNSKLACDLAALSLSACAGEIEVDTVMIEFLAMRLDTVNQCLWRRTDGSNDERILCGPQKLNSSVDTPIGNETVG
jgi:hypothetical protein